MQLQIFVPMVTYPEASGREFAANAVSVAARLQARLHARIINADMPDVPEALSRLLLEIPQLVRQVEEARRERGAHRLAYLEEKADAAGVELSTSAVDAPIAAFGGAAATQARYFDLTLVGWETGDTASRTVAEAVLFGSGRPVMLLPAEPDVAAFDHVAIAWDGGRVAARAVADARPILERASRVSVLTVVDEKPRARNEAGEQLAASLREYGLDAQAVPVATGNAPLAHTLQQAAIRNGCQLLVMGGYGHSRIRDFILGGATEGVLTSLQMPVLLSH